MTNEQDSRTVVLRLTRAEALVLFEWLTRVDASGNLPIEDLAEQQVLWQLEGQLEATLLEPLDPDYKLVLEAARNEVRGGHQ